MRVRIPSAPLEMLTVKSCNVLTIIELGNSIMRNNGVERLPMQVRVLSSLQIRNWGIVVVGENAT